MFKTGVAEVLFVVSAPVFMIFIMRDSLRVKGSIQDFPESLVLAMGTVVPWQPQHMSVE
jgi:hypothetical protein